MSTLAWLDVDEDDRRRMLEVVDLFREQGTLDSLGFGAVRDTISDALFPGTSTLHTRAKYLLYVPWTFRQIAREGLSGGEAVAAGRKRQLELAAQLARHHQQGVFGAAAGRNLKRLPSEAYWAATGTFGIRNLSVSADSYLRNARTYCIDTSDDAVANPAHSRLSAAGFHGHLPEPEAADLEEATFDLEISHAEYLRDRVISQPATVTSLFAWLLREEREPLGDFAWQVPHLTEAPASLLKTVDHARRFSHIVQGAHIAYKALLIEQLTTEGILSPDGPVSQDAVEEEWRAWQVALTQEATLSHWSQDDFWSLIDERNARVRVPTRQFINWWWAAVADGIRWDAPSIRDRLTEREAALKGARARLANRSARESWEPRGDIGRMDFRWRNARTIIADVLAPLVTHDAGDREERRPASPATGRRRTS